MAERTRIRCARNGALAPQAWVDTELALLPDHKPQKNEPWDSVVARAATETLAYLNALNQRFVEEGDVYVNVS